MNDKKIPIIICVIIILIIAILACIVAINKTKTDNVNNIAVENTNTKEIQNVTDRNKFYTVSNCVSQYLNEINKNNTRYYGTTEEGKYGKVVEEEYIKQNIYNLLSKEYIDKNNITIDNVYNHIDNIVEQVIFTPIKMNSVSGSKIEKYIVYGFVGNLDYKFIKEIYIVINLDIENQTFSIEPINYKYTNIDEIIIKNNNTNIQKNDGNTYRNIELNQNDIAKEYIDVYKKMALQVPEIAYQFLDEEYRDKRFGGIEAYKKYIEKNKNNIKQIIVDKYKTTNMNGYKQYVLIDQYDNYYIIKEKSVMQYSVILDTYTIDLPEYTEKYNNSGEKQKVAFCIDRFMKAIKDDNYMFAYEKLSEGFKSNYFKTEQNFETYIKQHLSNKYNLAYIAFNNEGNIYTYTVKLTNSNNDANPIQKTFIVKLKEGTDFELSFNVD